MSQLPAWGRAELPEPLPFSARNALRTIGPGAILLAASIGGGEWLVGPALGVRHGVGVFWIATVAIVLQTLLNLEAIRYTLYTGEPITAGFMRLRPSSRFWAAVYSILTVAQLGMPALGAACATVIFAAFAGRLPGAPDTSTLAWITYGVMAVTVLILLLGGTIERMLEWASWGMIAYIFVFLVIANVLFVPPAHWVRTGLGFLQFGYLPSGADVVLLATLAATAGSGGVGNLVISNWVRDKGWGMGAVAGAIPSAFGGRRIQLSHAGKVFDVNPDSLRRWRGWWRYVAIDQVALWAVGCFLGMYLNVNLATAIAPAGADLADVGAGAFQAKYMAERLWSGFWVLALLNGFWILFSTHLGNTDTLVRLVTDILWVTGDHRRQTPNVGRLYYSLLAIFTVWGAVTVQWGTAMTLFKALGVVAGPILGLAAVQILRVNTRLLPAELRPSLWRRAGLVLCAIFYVLMFLAVLFGR
ncbi:MAG: Nramp family divalent metal transporter [Acidobacteria bacterium]|nr:Nramp family divalent metal transporter [Acidobacteriota bacterium]